MQGGDSHNGADETLEISAQSVPWYVVGPPLGFLVPGLYTVANSPLSISGAYLQVALLTRGSKNERRKGPQRKGGTGMANREGDGLVERPHESPERAEAAARGDGCAARH